MAVVGNAEIVVTALTAPAIRQISSALNSAGRSGGSSGSNLGRSFMRGFNSQVNANAFTRVSRGINTLAPNATRARNAFTGLAQSGYIAGTALTSVVGSVGALVGGLGAFIGTAAGAIGSLAAIGSAGFAAASGIIAASLALGGVGKAYSALGKQRLGGGGGGGGGGRRASGGGGGGGDDSAAQRAAQEARYQATRRVEDAERSLALTIERNRENLLDANDRVRDAQEALNKALEDGREEIQQLGFDAEDAALSEQKAAIDLEKARETLARVQDLPPNSRARREAELAYQTAELNYRKTKDAAADLAAEQDRLAKTGVAGTDGVISATEELEKAELEKSRTARDGLRDQADAERDLADAKRDRAKADEKVAQATAAAADAGGGGGGGGGGVNPFAGLNQAQIDFVKGLDKLRDEFDELERVAAENFLPKLLKALNIVFDRAGVVFPVLRDGIGKVADAMGDGVVSLAEAIAEPANLKDLTGAFTGSAQLIRTAGEAAGNAWGAAITLVNEAMPIAQTFFEFLNTRLNAFDEWMDTPTGRNALQDFFERAEAAMAQFGRIFDNIFNGFGDIIDANLGGGGGQILLDWLEKATGAFATLQERMGEDSFSAYFEGAATNMQKMFSALGAIIGEIIALGDNPAIGQMWDKLGEAAPFLGNMMEKMVEAAPYAAALVVEIVKIADAFTDTVSAQLFFQTLLGFAKTASDFFKGELGQNILNTAGPILAVMLAVRTATKPLQFFANVALGGFGALSGAIGGIVGGLSRFSGAIAAVKTGGLLGGLKSLMGGFKKTGKDKDDLIRNLGLFDGKMAQTAGKTGVLSGALGRVGGAFKAAGAQLAVFGRALAGVLLGPIGIALGIIALLAAAFYGLYKTNDEFRASIDAAWAQISAAFSEAGEKIMAALMPLIPVFVNLINTIVNALVPAFIAIIEAIVPLITMLISELVPVFVQIINAIVPLVTTIIGSLVPVFVKIIEAVTPLITTLISELVPVFVQIINAIVPLVTTIIDALLPVFVQIIEAIAPVVSMIIDALVPVIVALVDALVPVITTIADMLVPVIQVLIDILNFLIPIFVAILKVVIDVFTNIVKFIGEAITNIIKWITDFIKNVSTNWNKFWGDIFKFFNDTWKKITTGVDIAVKAVQKVIATVISAIVTNWNKTWQGIFDFFDGIFSGIGDIVNGVRTTFEDVFGGIASFLETTFGGIVGFVRGPINAIIDLVNGAISSLNNFSITVPDWVPGIGGQNWGFSLPKIPRLAKGAVVMPSLGGSIVNVAEAGRAERIEPLDENGISKRDKAIIDHLSGGAGGGTTINVYQQPGQSMEDLAEEIDRRLSRRMRRGANG